MKRLFVISISKVGILVAAALVFVAVFIVVLWPKPVYGGEGGFAGTVYGDDLPAMADPDGGDDSRKGARLAIIIDDFGQGRDGVQQMMAINRHLTFAVMPFSTFTKEDAEAGYGKGYEIIVHLPMEPMRGPASWVGTNPILCSQDNEKISTITRMSLADVPHAKGANVHMGSRASADDRVMHCILREVARSGFFFVDSKTGVNSVIKPVSDELNVPCLERNVFLDGQRPKSYIIKQLRLAEDIALKKGYAVAIGHVGIEGGKPTADAISDMLAEFDEKGVQLVFVSEILGSWGPVAVQNN
jgi:polysaccharide deacetylase 2 family uncharacterized protein YibQ